LNLFIYYIYLTWSIVVIISILTGGIDTGWTFYTPYSVTTGGAVTMAVFGVFIIGFSSILTGVNFITTIHKLRAPGISWDKLSLFGWSFYSVSIIQILAISVLSITLSLVRL